jgi:IclR family transcriptional regulator, mhp operon transcriptional activator
MNRNQELRSLKRGLRALALIDQLGSITITELGRSLGVPRTTGERVLVTLHAEGFVDRDELTKRYFLSLRVRGLANGYSEASWIAHVAKPILFEATRRIGWPCASRSRTANIWPCASPPIPRPRSISTRAISVR